MQNVEILTRKQLALERGYALVKMLGTERTAKDKQQHSVLGHAKCLAAAGAIALNDRAAHRITGHKHMLRVALVLKDRARSRHRDAHAGGMGTHHLIGQTRNRVLLVQQIRNARILAPAQQRNLDVGTKTDGSIGLANL